MTEEWRQYPAEGCYGFRLFLEDEDAAPLIHQFVILAPGLKAARHCALLHKHLAVSAVRGDYSPAGD